MKNKNMQHIAEFVDKKANKQLSKSPKLDEIMRAKEILKKYSTKQKKDFTFTVGEMNAYLG